MDNSLENPRIHLTLSTERSELLTELAKEIGCSRAAVATYLLERKIDELSSVPARSRTKSLKDTRRILGSHDGWMQKTVRRARGPSLSYIATALDSIIDLARTRYDPNR